MSDYFRELDSLMRFYSSEVTAHSNFLVGSGFAYAVLFYKAIDYLLEWKEPHVYFFSPLLVLFIVPVLFLYGRLIYYTELTNILHHYMGLSNTGARNRSIFIDHMVRRTKLGIGLAETVHNYLFLKVQRRYFGRQVDESILDTKEDFLRIHRQDKISRKKACLITFGNISVDRYRDLIKQKIN